MSNEELVELFELTVKLMELHDADPVRMRNYGNVAFNLDRASDKVFSEMTAEQLMTIPGVGKSIAAKIVEIVRTGEFVELNELLARTPEGVIGMFEIKGIGAKKIKAIWKETGIDNLLDLELACQNGVIAKLKGFGEGTQQKILASMAFLKSQVGKLRMDKAEAIALMVNEELKKFVDLVAITGEVRRNMETVQVIQLLVGAESPVSVQKQIDDIAFLVQNEKVSTPFVWRGTVLETENKVEIVVVAPERFQNELFLLSSGEGHLSVVANEGKTLYQWAMGEPVETEEALYERSGLPYIVPEMRDGIHEFVWAEGHKNEELVTWDDLKGILHNHSTYSDGQHTLEQMALYCRELGFEYLGIADHSQTATYASGLKIEDIERQHAEINVLNERFLTENPEKPFKILKGIESDILGDGSLDYSDDILSTFDYVVASVHSNLTMSLEKATTRLLKAIENPYTTILGHPTGRLLLSRNGYPIDHKTIIDACAEKGVIMEINASPWRLDLDWRWIQYCIERGVMLSINPDAHKKEGYFDMRYGVANARKGGLTTAMTFNALTLPEMELYLRERKSNVLI
jgi:DNA polymerase (family 10)